MKKTLLLILSGLPLAAAAQNPDTLLTIDQVVITGTRTEISRSNVPLTLSVVDRRQIAESGESAVLSAIAPRVPGMFVTERGITGFGVQNGASGGITLRGIGGAPTTGVLMLIDGHPQYMGLMGHHLPDAYLASDVERVEVIRGPASILYGSNAMGGAINLITRRQKTEGWQGALRASLGSRNTQKYQGSAGVHRGKFDAYASLNHDRTDGHRENSAFRLTNGYLRAGVQLSERVRLWGDVSVAGYETQNPGTLVRPMIDNTADVLRGAASLSLENRGPKSEGGLKLFYNFGDHRVYDGYPAGGTPPVTHFRSNDLNGGLNLYQIFRPFRGSTITAGIDLKTFGGRARNRFDDGTPDAVLVDTTMWERAAYLLVQQQFLGRLTLNAGVRVEEHKSYGTEWVPQFGLAWRAGAYTVVKASVSKGFRSPTIREMFLWGGHNPALEPERVTNYEISVGRTLAGGRLTAELTGFIAEGSNLIRQEGTLLENTGSFSNRGVEASIRWAATERLDVQVSYSYLHMDTPVLYAPGHQLFVSGVYRLQKWTFSADWQLVRDLRSALGESPAIENYGLLDARVAFRPGRRLEFFVKGENLTDRTYQIMNGYPMPGATVQGGVLLSF